MKRFLFLLLSFSFVLLLVSCHPERSSFDELKNIDSEIEEEYISYSYGGLIINGKEEDIDFFDGSPTIHAYKINDHLTIKGFDYQNYIFYQTTYDLKNKTLIKNKLELNDFKSSQATYSNSSFGIDNGNDSIDSAYISAAYNDLYTAFIYHGTDSVNTAYIVDDDFNITKKVLSSVKGEYARATCNEYGIVFYTYEIDEDTSGYYKDNYLKSLNLYKDNEFVEFSFGDGYLFNERSYYSPKKIENSVLMIDNYFVTETTGKKPYFIYDLEGNKYITADMDIYDYINEELHKDKSIRNDIPKFQDVKKNKDYDYIFKAYCKNAIYDSTKEKIIKVDGVYYYIVATKVDVNHLPWLIRGDAEYFYLDARFIFRYNEKTKDISYVGYAKKDVVFFYTF